MSTIKLILLIFCAKASMIDAYRSGAPSQACQSLIPGHGVNPQQTQSPFDIKATLSYNNQQASSINVTISSKYGSESFAGFIMQAVLHSDPSIIVDGTFEYTLSTKTLKCNGRNPNTITHSQRLQNARISVLWIPPENFEEIVVFRASIVKQKLTFWVNQYSNAIEARGSGYNSKSHHAVANAISPLYRSCEKDILCFGLPENCLATGDCELLLTSSPIRGGDVEFEMVGKDSSKNRYFAMGFSDTKEMDDTLVIECSDSGKIKKSWNDKGRRNVPVDNEIAQIRSPKVENIDGKLHCTWTLDQSLDVSIGRSLKKQIDIHNKKYYLLLAYGPFRNNRKSHHEARTASQSKLSILHVGAVAGENGSPTLVKFHGCFMVIAWIGMVSISIMMARHFKNVWESQIICGTKLWFAFHRGLMVVSITTVIVGAILIFVHVGGWSRVPHGFIGLTANLLMVMQPIMAIFRCAPDDSKRYIFNWLHWFVGNSAHILAVAAVFTATSLPQAHLHGSFLWTLVGYVVFHVIVHLVMQVHVFTASNGKTDEYQMNGHDAGKGLGDESTKISSGTSFKKFMLALYVLIVSLLCLTLIYLIISN